MPKRSTLVLAVLAPSLLRRNVAYKKLKESAIKKKTEGIYCVTCPNIGESYQRLVRHGHGSPPTTIAAHFFIDGVGVSGAQTT